MNQIEAITAIILVARRDHGSLTDYKRASRALKALGFNTEDASVVLVHLDYHHPDTRAPYKWLADKL
ncbi:MAG: hypothetical protein M3R13_11990 [Armatimonadota bacterium]|nr:hypothetical protein [Armatimonadota bacterium]